MASAPRAGGCPPGLVLETSALSPPTWVPGGELVLILRKSRKEVKKGGYELRLCGQRARVRIPRLLLDQLCHPKQTIDHSRPQLPTSKVDGIHNRAVADVK